MQELDDCIYKMVAIMAAHKGSEHVMTSETVIIVPRGTAGDNCRITLAQSVLEGLTMGLETSSEVPDLGSKPILGRV